MVIANEDLFNAVCKGKRLDVQQLVQTALDGGANPEDLLMGSMIPAMRTMGEKFSRNEVYVPEMLIAARAMQSGMNVLEPVLAKKGHKPLGKVVIGTVKGDLHDIGKNLVAIMLKGAGFEVIDAGVDCDVEKYRRGVELGAQAVLCSALLTTTMSYMKVVVEAFASDPDVKVIVGGAPVTQEYADQIGAGGYGADAHEAVQVLERCLGIKK